MGAIRTLAEQMQGEPRADRLLAMPIHTVSESLGTEGLRQRLAVEVLSTFGLDNEIVLDDIDDAHTLAAELHKNDSRVREPYENHLLRVAIRGISPYHLGVDDQHFVPGLLLHDSVEDHSPELANLPADADPQALRKGAFRNIAERFGRTTLGIVKGMTNPLPVPAVSSQDQYIDHADDLVDEGPPLAIVGKMSDVMDNGVGIFWGGEASPEQFKKWATKYQRIVPILRRALGRDDLPLDKRARLFVVNQLDLADTRFRSILD